MRKSPEMQRRIAPLAPGVALITRESFFLAAQLLDEPGRLVELAHELDGLTRDRVDPRVWSAAACSKGCAACCVGPVDVAIFELLPIYAAIRGDEARAAKVRAAAEQAAYDPMHTRCPLVDEDGTCSQHSLRPAGCRAENSFSREACERGPDSYHQKLAEIYLGATAVLVGALSAVSARGMDARRFSLAQALAWLLQLDADPAALEQFWRAGGDLLGERAKRYEGGRMVAESWVRMKQGPPKHRRGNSTRPQLAPHSESSGPGTRPELIPATRLTRKIQV